MSVHLPYLFRKKQKNLKIYLPIQNDNVHMLIYQSVSSFQGFSLRICLITHMGMRSMTVFIKIYTDYQKGPEVPALFELSDRIGRYSLNRKTEKNKAMCKF